MRTVIWLVALALSVLLYKKLIQKSKRSVQPLSTSLFLTQAVRDIVSKEAETVSILATHALLAE